MATQAFLDATRNATFDTPTEWESIADAWELDVLYDADLTKQWVDAKIEVPVFATVLTARGISPDDMMLIRDFIDPDALLGLETYVAVLGIVKGIQAAGGEFTQDALIQIFSTFFTELSDGGVQLTVVP